MYFDAKKLFTDYSLGEQPSDDLLVLVYTKIYHPAALRRTILGGKIHRAINIECNNVNPRNR